MSDNAWRDGEDAFLEGAKVQLRSRVQVAMGEFISELIKPVTLFGTFTFDPLNIGMAGPLVSGERRAGLALPTVSRWCAMRRFAYFLSHASKVVGRPVAGVIALEDHRSGQPHGHGVFSTEGPVVGGDIGKLSLLWREYRGNGFVRLEEPLSDQDVTKYCAKYMAKDAGELVFSKLLASKWSPGRTL